MEDFKIELFEKENNGRPLEFTVVSSLKAKIMYYKLCERISFQSVANTNSSLYEFLQQNGNYVKGYDALSSDFDMSVLLEPYHLTENNLIFIIWDDIETIEMDCMRYQFFKCHLFDIWYPFSDNMVFFNDNLDFVYLIRHDGVLFNGKLTRRK